MDFIFELLTSYCRGPLNGIIPNPDDTENEPLMVVPRRDGFIRINDIRIITKSKHPTSSSCLLFDIARALPHFDVPDPDKISVEEEVLREQLPVYDLVACSKFLQILGFILHSEKDFFANGHFGNHYRAGWKHTYEALNRSKNNFLNDIQLLLLLKCKIKIRLPLPLLQECQNFFVHIKSDPATPYICSEKFIDLTLVMQDIRKELEECEEIASKIHSGRKCLLLSSMGGREVAKFPLQDISKDKVGTSQDEVEGEEVESSQDEVDGEGVGSAQDEEQDEVAKEEQGESSEVVLQEQVKGFERNKTKLVKSRSWLGELQDDGTAESPQKVGSRYKHDKRFFWKEKEHEKLEKEKDRKKVQKTYKTSLKNLPV